MQHDSVGLGCGPTWNAFVEQGEQSLEVGGFLLSLKSQTPLRFCQEVTEAFEVGGSPSRTMWDRGA